MHRLRSTRTAQRYRRIGVTADCIKVRKREAKSVDESEWRPPLLLDGFLSRTRELLGRYLVAGTLVFAPVGITLWAVGWAIERLDKLLLPSVLGFFYGEAEA